MRTQTLSATLATTHADAPSTPSVLELSSDFQCLSGARTKETIDGRAMWAISVKLFIHNYGNRFAVVASEQRDFSVNERYSTTRDVRILGPLTSSIGDNSVHVLLNELIAEFEGRTCSVKAEDGARMLRITLRPGTKNGVFVAHFTME